MSETNSSPLLGEDEVPRFLEDPDDPHPQLARNGLMAGAWRTGVAVGALPPDCPVKPLGRSPSEYVYVDAIGRVFAISEDRMNALRLAELFRGKPNFLAWAWPIFDGEGAVSDVDAEAAWSDLRAAATIRE